MYGESMDILEHQIKPLRKVPGVVLEQTYLNRMSDGLKPLQVLAASQGKNTLMKQIIILLCFQMNSFYLTSYRFGI